MKNASIFFAATLIFLFVSQSMSAQKTATWKGGTPGRSTDWNCPTNWKEGRVPDAFSNVVIPDVSTSTFSYPIIGDEVEIQSLQCAPSARLTVLAKASLVVLLPLSERPETRGDRFIIIGSHLGYAELPEH
ncbi:MAG: hypothetical protein H7246_23280 [Phycisphaerae bacterium]|nr:hypothetical protein [Saprospiraceae bacterium]